MTASARPAPITGASFPAISGAGPNGAVIHYRVTPETSRALQANEVYLIDSGGRYPLRHDGHHPYPSGPVPTCRMLISATPSPVSCAGISRWPGRAFHRGDRPRAGRAGPSCPVGRGLDYDHGTGHGIGSYLSVHEGPATIAPVFRPVMLRAGMILSNEPGYYRPGAFGIRLENLHLVRHPPLGKRGARSWNSRC
ncbi:M24 family metallopeptidase [Komagataeibacter rhaeticus]|nr:M24 family metallopeptidase [Komagataeibacter rhaeticus]